MDVQTARPNHKVKLVFEQKEDEDVTYINIFIEADGREITPDLIVHGNPTLAETWGHDMLGFIEDLLRRMLNGNKGYVLAMPKKKDMN